MLTVGCTPQGPGHTGVGRVVHGEARTARKVRRNQRSADGTIASLGFVVAHNRGAGVDCEAHFAASCMVGPGPDSSVGLAPLRSTYSQHTVKIQST